MEHDNRLPSQEYASDDNGKDEGVNIRRKAKELISLIQDTERLREERRRSKASKDKYFGVSCDQAPRSRHKRSRESRPSSIDSDYRSSYDRSTRLEVDSANEKSKTPDNASSVGSSAEFIFRPDNTGNCQLEKLRKSAPANMHKVDLGAAKSYAAGNVKAASFSAAAASKETNELISENFLDIFSSPYSDMMIADSSQQASSFQPDFGVFQSNAPTKPSVGPDDDFGSFMESRVPPNVGPPGFKSGPTSAVPAFIPQMGVFQTAPPSSAGQVIQGSFMAPQGLPMMASQSYGVNSTQPTPLHDSSAVDAITIKSEEKTEPKSNTWSAVKGIDISLDSLTTKNSGQWKKKTEPGYSLKNLTDVSGKNVMQTPTYQPVMGMVQPNMQMPQQNPPMMVMVNPNATPAVGGGAYFGYPMMVNAPVNPSFNQPYSAVRPNFNQSQN